MEIVREDFGVVEGERRRERARREDARALRVVGRDRRSAGAPDEDGREGVLPRVARRVGVDAEEGGECHVKPGLLARLADRGVLDALAVLDEPARDRPAGGRVSPPDEDNPARDLDDDVDGGGGVAVAR